MTNSAKDTHLVADGNSGCWTARLTCTTSEPPDTNERIVPKRPAFPRAATSPPA